MFELDIKSIDDTLWKEVGCAIELKCIERNSWMKFSRFLEDLVEKYRFAQDLLPEKKLACTFETSNRRTSLAASILLSWRASICLVAVTIAIASSSAIAGSPLSPQEVGRVAGSYIFSGRLVTAMQRSPCAYVFIRKPAVDEAMAMAEVKRTLSPSMYAEIERYFASSQGKKRLAEMDAVVSSAIAAARKDGYDDKTACGMVMCIVAGNSGKALQEWREFSLSQIK